MSTNQILQKKHVLFHVCTVFPYPSTSFSLMVVSNFKKHVLFQAVICCSYAFDSRQTSLESTKYEHRHTYCSVLESVQRRFWNLAKKDQNQGSAIRLSNYESQRRIYSPSDYVSTNLGAFILLPVFLRPYLVCRGA